MTTMGSDGPQQVNLNEMLARGGREAAMAFHLLSIEYHASIIETSGDAEDLEMLGDMLVQHLMGVRALIAEAAVNLDVVSPSSLSPAGRDLDKPGQPRNAMSNNSRVWNELAGLSSR